PGYLVKSVCHVPFGAHPQGMLSPISGLFDSYAPDYEFVAEHRLACQKPSEIDSWIKKWVLDCKNQEEYIIKLGESRINLLKEKANEDYWKKSYNAIIDKATHDRVPNEIEIMIMMASRKVAEIMQENNYRILLGGLGAGMLASWVAYYQLREKDYDIDLIVGSGSFGFAPRPGDPFYGTYSNLHSCKAFFDTADTYGYILSGNNKRSLSILGAAQIDKYGNINSTKMGNNYLLGSGGANDAINASEVLIVAKQSRQRFIDKVPYITCPGRNIKTLVSDMGIFEKAGEGSEFKLTACLPSTEGAELEEKIQRIRENCGWELKLSTTVKELPMPEQKDFLAMRLFDPERLVIGD
ncbi:MAG: hypothetical protein SV375_20690, partial [Thermodesulfobacteriota bacterium]|nr:hypothetical protein [Thermodesulfobacteriota bacterium]